MLSLDSSPIKGPEGNIEYLLFIQKNDERSNSVSDEMIDQTVDNAHSELDR